MNRINNSNPDYLITNGYANIPILKVSEAKINI